MRRSGAWQALIFRFGVADYGEYLSLFSLE
jgi:hypothetical protein